MTVLITGANGFIGSALCRALSSTGQQFRRAVRTGIMPGDITVGDIGGKTDWRKAVNGVTCVVHLAARVHAPQQPPLNPIEEYRRINVTATENLARACGDNGVQRLVFLSSIKVNGDCTFGQPFTENDTPSPEDPYAISKLEAEQRLRRIAGETGLGIVVLRPPLVYGPGVKGNFLRLLELAQRGWPLPLASAHNKRSLIYVENLVDALITCMTQREAAGKTYLVSDDIDISTPQLFRQISAHLGVRARLLPCPPTILRAGAAIVGRSTEAARLLASLQIDSSLIRRELGWRPPFTMEQGLKRTAEWYHAQTRT